MANLHIRSNSQPSKSHPIVNDVEDHLCRLKSSEGTSTSTSATSICANLASLRDLHEGINNLIQMPSTLCNNKWSSELLEESLGLVDLCGFARDVLILTKGSVQELQSSIRRNGGESYAADDIKANYMESRKRITKMVNKYIKNFKILDNDSCDDVTGIERMIIETGAFDFSVLKSVLMLFCEKSKKRISWSLFSKKLDRDCSFEELCSLKQLKAVETNIDEVEEGLEAFFRSLVKTRVYLLNALNH